MKNRFDEYLHTTGLIGRIYRPVASDIWTRSYDLATTAFLAKCHYDIYTTRTPTHKVLSFLQPYVNFTSEVCTYLYMESSDYGRLKFFLDIPEFDLHSLGPHELVCWREHLRITERMELGNRLLEDDRISSKTKKDIQEYLQYLNPWSQWNLPVVGTIVGSLFGLLIMYRRS